MRDNLTRNTKNPNAFWNCIKRSQPKILKSEPNISADTWYTYFKDLFSHAHTDDDEQESIFENLRQNRDDSLLDSRITDAEIIRSVNSLRGSCASGLDGICVEMLQSTVHISLPYLNKLFNHILDNGNFPAEWSENMIVPIHKKGSVNNPNNFRAISLVNSISKVFTKILSTRLSEWCEDNDVIDESQAGFRRGYSTIDNIFSLNAVIQKYLSKRRGRVYVFYIDFLKAFDNCVHAKLWECLSRHGVNYNGKFLSVFKSMYEKLKSCVRTKDGLTDFFRCNKGTKQGCVSSTVIFAMYINDLVTYLKLKCGSGVFITDQIDELYAFMFADDVAGVADTVVKLQHQINYVDEFCAATGMKVNVDKSQIMVFRNGGPVKNNEKWYINRQQIKIVPMYKYLGAYFTTSLSWTKTQLILSSQANKAVNHIFRCQRQFGYFTRSELFKLFDSYVKPILTYSSQIWGYRTCYHIEQVHINFCKRVTGLNKNVANYFALSECSRLPMSVVYMKICVKYWLKITQMNNARYPRQCYIMLRGLDSVGRCNWATHVKWLLHRYGFGFAWLADGVGDVNAFLTLFTTRLTDCALQTLSDDIQTSPKAQLYKTFKVNFDPECYLSMPLSYKFKRILSNFRCSGHGLMIEVGRHQNVDRNQRFCKFCLNRNIQVIEDELHFLLHCPLYCNLRNMYFLQRWKVQPCCLQTFVNIMSDNSTEAILSLSKYLYYSFETRANHLP